MRPAIPNDTPEPAAPSTPASRARAEHWQERELLILREMARLVGKSLEPAHVIRDVLHLLSEFIGLNRGRLLLVDPGSGMLKIRHAYGLSRSEIARGQFAPSEGITGRAFSSGMTVIVQDIDADSEYLGRTVTRASLPQETVSYIAHPLAVDGVVVGVLAAHRLRRRDRALADDVALLRVVAAWIAQILKINQQLEQRTAALVSENATLKSALQRSPAAHGIVGESAGMRQLFEQLELVSQTTATVLLLGESGTGKEMFARALHLSSPRRDAPFVRVNCGAIPEALFESELFGHEKGAFTGATTSRAGKFEQANQGTLFLDEVGDLPLAMQVKLLRVLQERVIERIGGSREIALDVRLVAATSRDLNQLVREGQFRLDLFYRLNIVPLRLPALRERSEDIPALARHHLHQINQQYGRDANLTEHALRALAAYPWPGNVRQLRNLIERLVLLARQPAIDAAMVDAALSAEQITGLSYPDLSCPDRSIRAATVTDAKTLPDDPSQPATEWGIAQLEAALARAGGNKSRAARNLGMTLRQLDYRLRKLRKF